MTTDERSLQILLLTSHNFSVSPYFRALSFVCTVVASPISVINFCSAGRKSCELSKSQTDIRLEIANILW